MTSSSREAVWWWYRNVEWVGEKEWAPVELSKISSPFHLGSFVAVLQALTTGTGADNY